MYARLASICFFVFLLFGCAGQTPAPPVLINRAPLNVTPAPTAQQYPYSWQVITKDNAQIKLTDQNPVLLGLTPDGYLNLNLSIAELRKYIEEEQAIIKAYEDYENQTPVTSMAQKKPWWQIW